MRKFNAVLTALIMVLFLLHAVFGAMALVGVNYNALKMLARVCATLIIIHTVIGVKLTIDSLRVWKKTGAPYLRENGLFWARGANVSASMGEDSSDAVCTAVFRLPGLTAPFLGQGAESLTGSWNRTIYHPAKLIRKVRGIHYVSELL